MVCGSRMLVDTGGMVHVCGGVCWEISGAWTMSFWVVCWAISWGRGHAESLCWENGIFQGHVPVVHAHSKLEAPMGRVGVSAGGTGLLAFLFMFRYDVGPVRLCSKVLPSGTSLRSSFSMHRRDVRNALNKVVGEERIRN